MSCCMCAVNQAPVPWKIRKSSFNDGAISPASGINFQYSNNEKLGDRENPHHIFSDSLLSFERCCAGRTKDYAELGIILLIFGSIRRVLTLPLNLQIGVTGS